MFLERHASTSRKIAIPTSESDEQIWRLLRNIQSSDTNQLRIEYSYGGIVLHPGNSIGPFAGSITRDNNTLTVTIGSARSESTYPFYDNIVIGAKTGATFRHLQKKLTAPDVKSVTYPTIAADVVTGGLTSYFAHYIIEHTTGSTFTATLEVDGNQPDGVFGTVGGVQQKLRATLGRIILTVDSNNDLTGATWVQYQRDNSIKFNLSTWD